MSVVRPTFHEAWYRVADLRPRLLSGVKVYKQHFRGQLWYVLANPVNNQYSRLSPEAYRFIGLLDGRRTVSVAWQLCNEQLGDSAPTQGEVIQLLGQLHAANLLYADLSPDAESLFRRYQKRLKREVLGYLGNFLFIRFPLFDPDQLLDRWVKVVGRLFNWLGLVLWLLLLGVGLYFVVGNFGQLLYDSADVLAPGNLILLYLGFVVIKVCHEFSHAFACKKFGQLNQGGGEVHTMGVMFLVFFPLPYVDASSAWAFRSKWHRAIVGMSGVMAELAVAAVAAIIWAHTSIGTLHIIAYNCVFVASVSTLLFNGNPLLRFDAYYVLSDLIEIPNLSHRSKNFLYYLVKRYFWGLKKIQSPAYSLGERVWFLFYGVASTAYRVFICIRILLFLNDRLPEDLFILVPLLAFGAIVAWVLIPVGRFFKFLATGAELARNRLRAVGTTLAALCLAIILVGLVRFADYGRLEGIVEPVRFAIVYAESDGFVTDFLRSESIVSPGGPPLIRAVNVELEAERNSASAERRGLEIRRREAFQREIAAAQILGEQIEALDAKIARIESELASLELAAPLEGVWVAPDIERIKGTYLQRGQRIGFVGSLDELIIRATAGQNIAAMLIEQADRQVEIRVKGRPESEFIGEIEKIFPAGQELLPSEALSFAVGGSIPTRWAPAKRGPSPEPRDARPPDVRRARAAERFFEIRISQIANHDQRFATSDKQIKLLTGQRVIVRVRMTPKPLILQWWQGLRQLFQRRFHI
ncbi:MAG: hypothetical protein ACE5NM_03540 [Sedimentisphaerales bacterium]